MFLPFFPLAQIFSFPPSQQVIIPQNNSLPPSEINPLVTPLRQQVVTQIQEIRTLPGQLDPVPVFNSNSPEIVQTEGILLSTFPPQGKTVSGAHLNFPFKGRFDIFTHHIARAKTRKETRTLFQAILIYNPHTYPVALNILQGATYLTQPDASFINLPSYVDNPFGNIFAGPGSRTTNDVLRGWRQKDIPPTVIIPPRQNYMLKNLPIPVGKVTPSSNGRTTLMRLSSSDFIYVASLAMFAPLDRQGKEQIPTLKQWENLLITGKLAGPRDIPPTELKSESDFIYGRVAGVAQGSQWKAFLTDTKDVNYLSIPPENQAFSYPISTTHTGTLGTGQVQSATLLARYPDTAYYAHGNYGVQYSLNFPLRNQNSTPKQVSISLQTPLKVNHNNKGLMFFEPPEDRVFFRGTVRVAYQDDLGMTQERYIHLVQRRGQQGEPLIILNMKPEERRQVQLDLVYPPDATPPQVVTVKTLR